MKISIICVGKIKEKYISSAIEEYQKRLRNYVKLNIIEVPDQKIPETFTKAQKEQAKLKEAELLLKYINNQLVVALCIEAKQMDSLQFSQFFAQNMLKGNSDIAFIIGGSLGLHNCIINRADILISFSKMTFPHQLIRIFLLEQIYRAHKILANEPYHK